MALRLLPVAGSGLRLSPTLRSFERILNEQYRPPVRTGNSVSRFCHLHSICASRDVAGKRYRAVADPAVHHAREPGSRRPAAHGQGSHCVRVGQCGGEQDLSCRCLGSPSWYGYHATHHLGYVLQRHGSSTGWTPFYLGWDSPIRPFFGEPRTATYDPTTGTFTNQQNMAHGRWYPTGTVLGDGRVLVFSGLSNTGGTNTTFEIYSVGSGWGPETAAPWTPPLYPRMHVLPNGTVFYSGSGIDSSIFNPSTNTWAHAVATSSFGTRTYGSSVLLPLTPANNYKPRVIIFGGHNPSTATTEIIDLSVAKPAWVLVPTCPSRASK